MNIVIQALRDTLAGRHVSEFGLEPWIELAGLKRERLRAVPDRAKAVRAEG